MKKIFLSIASLLFFFFLFPSNASADNTQWRLIDHPSSSPNSVLLGVYTESSNNVWTIGVEGIDGSPIMQHWNGSQWSNVQIENLPSNSYLTAINGSSANNIWAVGSYISDNANHPLIVHWNGTQWNVVSGASAHSNGTLYSVSTTSSNDVWVGGVSGNTLHVVQHWDGNSWQVSPINVPSDPGLILGMHANSSNDVWAIGFYNNNGHTYPLTEHWDGAIWQTISTPQSPLGTEYAIFGVSGTGPNDVWISGLSAPSDPSMYYDVTSANTLIMHWDGTSWSIVPSPNGSYGSSCLTSISAVNANNVWAAGGMGGPCSNHSQHSLVEHWNGTSWSVVSVPDTGTAYSNLFAISADQNNNIVGVGYLGDTSSNNLIMASGLVFLANSAPDVSDLQDVSINEGNTYTTSGSFTDPDSASWSATVNYGDGSGTQSLSLNVKNFSLNHIYNTPGTYTVTVAVTDNQGLSGTETATITVVHVDTLKVTSLSPVKVWLSKNILNIGTKFDLKAEVYKGSSLISSGQINSVTAGSGGFGNATLETIPFDAFTPVDFPTGSQLSVKVYARTACTGSLLGSGNATLWYNDSAANSKFGATIGTGTNDYYLRSGSLLTTTVGTGPRVSSVVATGAKCSAFKSFGTWAVTP